MQKRVRSDQEEILLLLKTFEKLFLFLGLHAAVGKKHVHADLVAPLFQSLVMLSGQDLGRRHDGGVVAALHSHQHGGGRHDRFAASDVALQKAVHRAGREHVVLYLAEDAELVLGQLERQRVQKIDDQFSRHEMVRFVILLLHDFFGQNIPDLQREEFIDYKAPFCSGDLLFVRAVRRVQQSYRFGNIRKPVFP